MVIFPVSKGLEWPSNHPECLHLCHFTILDHSVHILLLIPLRVVCSVTLECSLKLFVLEHQCTLVKFGAAHLTWKQWVSGRGNTGCCVTVTGAHISTQQASFTSLIQQKSYGFFPSMTSSASSVPVWAMLALQPAERRALVGGARGVIVAIILAFRLWQSYFSRSYLQLQLVTAGFENGT